MTSRPVDLEVVGWGPKHGEAHADVAHYDFWHRFGHAMEAVALVWLVAIPLMFVPWLVILVFPMAIALSVYLAAVRLRAPHVARRCQGVCPDCGYSGLLDMPLRFQLPLAIECPKCSRELTLLSDK
jgi:hypothetical protein